MNVQINNESVFVDDFIGGLSKITDTGIIEIKNNKATCLTTTGDDTIIISSSFTFNDSDDIPDVNLNIPDFKKLYKLLSLIDRNNFTLKITPASISFTSDDIKFKMHLYDDGILASPSINVQKINSIPFSNTFEVNVYDLKNLAKSSFLLPEVKKVYFTFCNEKVYGEITDKTQHNVDSFTMLLCNNVEGEMINKSLPVSIDVLRLLTSVKNDSIIVKYSNDYGILTFDVCNDNLFMKYIVSGLVN